MGFSSRIFLVDEADNLYRLPNTTLAGMLRDPEGRPLPRFAGQRVRMADAIVQLGDRMPIGVVRLTFGILAFDKEGRVDSDAFQQQQFARAESAFARLIPVSARNSSIIDASTRFVARGGA